MMYGKNIQLKNNLARIRNRVLGFVTSWRGRHFCFPVLVMLHIFGATEVSIFHTISVLKVCKRRQNIAVRSETFQRKSAAR